MSIFVGMSAQDVLLMQKANEREDQLRRLPDLPKIEISEDEKRDFYNKFGKSASMLQCLNLYEEVNRLTKLLILSDNEKEIQRISKKLDVYNKIVTLYKNSSDTVNKMGVGMISKDEKSGEDGEIEVDGIDIKIER